MTSIQPLRQWRVDSLEVRLYPDKKALSGAAAEAVAAILGKTIAAHGRAVAVFATGASQFDFLAALSRQTDITWSQVTAFHLDEYAGMSAHHPASFRRFLREHLFDIVKPGEVHYLEGDAPDLQAECDRYGRLLEKEGPPDVACIGIGENGHLAFNDPHVADFSDPARVKIVDLDGPCRHQQYDEGWFPTFDNVPKLALSQTISAIMASRAISCVVPEQRKAQAVQRTLKGPVDPGCPASILRRHPNCVLYLDRESASLLEKVDTR